MNIDTLIDDIHEKVDAGFEPNEDHMQSFLDAMKWAVTRQMTPSERGQRDTLRMSNIGKPDRQLWYEINGGVDREELTPSTRLKFLFGDMVEALLIFLIRESGHELTDEQAKVEVDGIVGHMDCSIDGVPTDIKSASAYAFKKFKDGSLADNDPFGYIAQISSYAYAKKSEEAAFFAMDKQSAKLALMPVHEMDMIDVPARIKHMKEVVARDTPPEKCFKPVPDGKSGNMKLNVNCSYCAFKVGCWSDANDGKGLRLFLYGNGPRWLTTVEREPDVFEKEVA
jgi:CRISPR/Cas system-associated exonuclease Cas4 (RecB family)